MHETKSQHQTVEDAKPPPIGQPGRRIEFDYLRTFVVLLVVLHHAILAYGEGAFINPEDPIQTYSPVVDLERWFVFDIITGFNDVYFMALMFFISGLFVWTSLARKGAGRYFTDRLIRLGIPLVIAVPLLIPLAYYPAQLTVELVYGGDTSYAQFWLDMVQRGFRTAGPLWFLWVLLVFDGVVTLFYRIVGGKRDLFGGRTIRVFDRPVPFHLVLFAVSTAAYLPLSLVFEPWQWVGFGPFVAQASRLLFYFVYFAAGVAISAYGLERSLCKAGGSLAKYWWAALPVGIVSYFALIAIIMGPPRPFIGGTIFTLSCSALALGFAALFIRFAKRSVPLLNSLAASAYGIYIFHYVFVTWLQYGLLSVDISVIAKALVVFIGAVALSWGVTAALKRIALVRRVL